MSGRIEKADLIFVGDGRDRFMKRLFHSWHVRLMEHAEMMRDDVPYWYGERTHVGLLAAAALGIDGTIALEEYGIRRGKEKASVAGRADLYLYHPPSGRSYDLEYFCAVGVDESDVTAKGLLAQAY